MTYIYAYSNHKAGLSRLRRMAVLYQQMQDQGIEVEMLTNDHRAISAVREYGISSATTIQTVWDIDSVAQWGDSLIIDTPEDDEGKLEQYVEMFNSVSRVANTCDEKSQFGEELLYPDPMVDPYFLVSKRQEKVERKLLFVGDSDSDKWLLEQAEYFAGLDLELLLGEYFYVGYETALESYFPIQHEAENYRECISQSHTIVTSEMQTAYEARAAGARVLYLNHETEICHTESLKAEGIEVIRPLDISGYI
jgi:hypothetical protein